MTKFLLVAPLALILTACGTTNSYDKRAEEVEKIQTQHVERTISEAPEWMTKLPEPSKSVVYANGADVSTDYHMAIEKAKLNAFGTICMSAGGKVDKQSKMFSSDTNDVSVKTMEIAIRTKCQETDISGVEIHKSKIVSVGNKYRAYVLIALPIGEANQIAISNNQRKAEATTKARADAAFQELDKNRQ